MQIPYICHVFSYLGLDIHLAEVENDLMILSVMLKSPHSIEFRLHMGDWVQTLRDLGRFDILKRKKKRISEFPQQL